MYAKKYLLAVFFSFEMPRSTLPIWTLRTTLFGFAVLEKFVEWHSL
jgi:hypothetical protein